MTPLLERFPQQELLSEKKRIQQQYDQRELNNLARLTLYQEQRKEDANTHKPHLHLQRVERLRAEKRIEGFTSHQRQTENPLYPIIFDYAPIIERYTKEFPVEMEMLRKFNMHPLVASEAMKNPYTGEPSKDRFRNIGYHTFAVAFLAESIAKRVFENQPDKVRQVVSQALLHDINKPLESMLRDHIKAQEALMSPGQTFDKKSVPGAGAYTAEAYEQIASTMATMVDPDKLEYFQKAGSETGHRSIKDFSTVRFGKIAFKEPNTDQELINAIVHLADDMTNSPVYEQSDPPDHVYVSQYLDAAKRMEKSNFPDRYGFLYEKGLKFKPDGGSEEVDDARKTDERGPLTQTYAELQPFISGEIARYLVREVRSEIQAPVSAQETLIRMARDDYEQLLENNKADRPLFDITWQEEQQREPVLDRVRRLKVFLDHYFSPDPNHRKAFRTQFDEKDVVLKGPEYVDWENSLLRQLDDPYVITHPSKRGNKYHFWVDRVEVTISGEAAKQIREIEFPNVETRIVDIRKARDEKEAQTVLAELAERQREEPGLYGGVVWGEDGSDPQFGDHFTHIYFAFVNPEDGRSYQSKHYIQKEHRLLDGKYPIYTIGRSDNAIESIVNEFWEYFTTKVTDSV